MSLHSKLLRLTDMLQMSKRRGLLDASRVAWNRYCYDHFTSGSLPVLCKTRPYCVQIETSRACNLRCKMCEYSYRQDNGPTMRVDAFKTVLAQFPSVQSVDVTGIGEPFCNKDFLDIVRHAKSQGLYVVFSTNGNLFTEDIMQELIDIQVDQIRFSLDAATKKTHEDIRRGSDFTRVTGAIALLSRMVVQAGKSKPQRHISYTISHENLDEAPLIVNLARELGVGGVTFLDLIVFQGGVYDTTARIDVASEGHMARIGEQIREAAEQTGVEVTTGQGLSMDRPPRMICMRPWMNAYVNVQGDLYPCCLVTQRNEDTDKHKFGNLFVDRFDDIWNSTAYQTLREEMAHPTVVPQMCVGCKMVRKRSAVDRASEARDAGAKAQG